MECLSTEWGSPCSHSTAGDSGRWLPLTDLLLQLGQLPRELLHQTHGGLQLLLQGPDLVLLAVTFIADEGHGSHPRKPVQILLLKENKCGNRAVSVGGSRHYAEYSWLFIIINRCKSVSSLGRPVHICNPIILEAQAGACLGVQGQYGLHNEFQTSLGYKAGLSQIKTKIQCLSAYTIK